MVSFEQAAYHFNLRTFSSYQELLYFLERNCKYLEEVCHYLALSTAPIKKESGRYLDFSKTNIQVEGVDKPNEIYYFSVSEPVDAMTPSTPQEKASSNRYSWSAETAIHKVEIKDGRIYYVASAKVSPKGGFILFRFMGNRAYLVTFKKVDPFFVVDSPL